jgi:hypothetical protein
MSVDFNNSDEYVKEFKIFNDGKAGIVENVKMRIEKKAPGEDDQKPMYKLIATDNLGEINEGFYYQTPDDKGELKGFENYQAQKLIMLAKGVLGENVIFPVFNTPKEALDGIMKLVAPEISKKPFRIAACYGTTKRKTAYLGFKSFGRFIQPMTEVNNLSLGAGDSTVRAVKEATPTEKLVSGLTASGNPNNLDWLGGK